MRARPSMAPSSFSTTTQRVAAPAPPAALPLAGLAAAGIAAWWLARVMPGDDDDGNEVRERERTYRERERSERERGMRCSTVGFFFFLRRRVALNGAGHSKTRLHQLPSAPFHRPLPRAEPSGPRLVVAFAVKETFRRFLASRVARKELPFSRKLLQPLPRS